MTKYYPALHSLRGFAAIWVYLLHIWFYSGQPDLFFTPFLSLGWVGVHLFYILSSFLLGTIYFSHQQSEKWSLATFYKKRFLRIFPAYYVQLIIMLTIAYFGYLHFPEIKSLIAHLFMYFHLPPYNIQPLNGVWWTLPIEFGFYLILPLLVLVLRKVGPLLFILLSLLITYSYRYWVYQTLEDESIGLMANTIGQLPGVLIIFSLGLTCAYILHNHKSTHKNNNYVAILALIGTTLWSSVLFSNKDFYWSGSLLLYFWESINTFFLVLFVAYFYQSRNKFLTHKVFVFLGKISYGVYLWHLPIILLMKDYVHDFYQLLMVTAPLTLTLASLSYYYVERKFSKSL